MSTSFLKTFQTQYDVARREVDDKFQGRLENSLLGKYVTGRSRDGYLDGKVEHVEFFLDENGQISLDVTIGSKLYRNVWALDSVG